MKQLPHYVKYTGDVEAGDQFLCRVRINPAFKLDVGLHAHEYKHIKQWYVMMLLSFSILVIAAFVLAEPRVFLLSPLCIFAHNILYRTRPYRQFAEVQAFKEQAKYNDDSFIEWAANHLAMSYNLNISKEKALTLLK